MLRGITTIAALAMTAAAGSPAAQQPAISSHTVQIADADQLSSFGERPAYSPDGKRIAFVGKPYGDAFEIDLATRRVRNLTAHMPHQGIARIQYLPSGDFLVTAPRIYEGEKSRGKLELWVLAKDLQRGLMPLGQPVFEGTAVSRTRNRIGFAVVTGRSPRPGEIPPTAFFVADVDLAGPRPRLVDRRKIEVKGTCAGEAQDFRDSDRELLVACYVLAEPGRGYWAGAYGLDLASGRLTSYRDAPEEYNEIEGVAPDGGWTAVECAPRSTKGVGAIDICRLDLRAGGAMSLLIGAEAGETRKVNNPVVSPDGRWMAFATASIEQPLGSGDGIMRVALK